MLEALALGAHIADVGVHTLLQPGDGSLRLVIELCRQRIVHAGPQVGHLLAVIILGLPALVGNYEKAQYGHGTGRHDAGHIQAGGKNCGGHEGAEAHCADFQQGGLGNGAFHLGGQLAGLTVAVVGLDDARHGLAH